MHSSLELGLFLETISSSGRRPSTKALLKLSHQPCNSSNRSEIGYPIFGQVIAKGHFIVS